jgi:TolB-like protein/predicted Ser/Thr protein kinase
MAPPAPDRGPGPGCVVGAYVLDELLGKGGMGEVYRARDQRLNRTVAIKFVSADKAADAGAAERLANEARVNSALNHPGIVTVYDIGRYRGRPFIVMEFVDGETLLARLKRGPVKLREALALGAQIAAALAAAHVEGVVHRDLKPQNIMLTTDGRAKIVDFGLGMMMQRDSRNAALATSETETMRLSLQGTVGYMSPEQASGLPPDLRADQFALGAILYEMVSGRRAFARRTDVQTLSDIIDGEPVPLSTLCPNAPPALVAIVYRCLQKNPRDRYASTIDLAHDLKVAADATAGGKARSFKDRSGAPSRVVRVLVLVAAVLAIIALAGWQRFGDASLASSMAVQSAVRQVVILPMVAATPADRALADGLVATVTNRVIAQPRFTRGLRVVPVSDVRRQNVVSAEEARVAFGATLAIGGSLRRDGEFVQLTFNLIDSVQAIHLASCTIELPAWDHTGLQEMATQAAMSLLALQLEPSPGDSRPSDPGTLRP